MNEDILNGKWKQFKGDIQEKWGDLTDDELDQANGNRNKILGTLQERYGLAKDEAEKQLKDFEDSIAA